MKADEIEKSFEEWWTSLRLDTEGRCYDYATNREFVEKIKQLIASREKRVAEEIFKDIEEIASEESVELYNTIDFSWDWYQELRKKYLGEGESKDG